MKVIILTFNPTYFDEIRSSLRTEALATCALRRLLTNCLVHTPAAAIDPYEPKRKKAHTGALSRVREWFVADILGESPNLIDDLFKDLEDWEALLKTLPEFDGDDILNEDDPPGISPR